MEDRKKCVRCGKIKLFGEFSLITKLSQRLRYECKECSKQRIYEWRAKNHEKISAYRKAYMRSFREKHPLVYKCSYIRRRLGSVGIATVEKLYHEHPYCEYCGVGLSMKEAGLDHALPISRGGSPDNPKNLIVCCFDCNQLKGTRTAEEFKVFVVEYAKRLAGLYLAKPGECLEGVTVRGGIIPISAPALD